MLIFTFIKLVKAHIGVVNHMVTYGQPADNFFFFPEAVLFCSSSSDTSTLVFLFVFPGG